MASYGAYLLTLILPYFYISINSYFHTSILSSFHTFMLSYFRTCTLSYFHIFIFPYFYISILSYFRTFLLLYFHIFMLPYFHTFTHFLNMNFWKKKNILQKILNCGIHTFWGTFLTHKFNHGERSLIRWHVLSLVFSLNFYYLSIANTSLNYKNHKETGKSQKKTNKGLIYPNARLYRHACLKTSNLGTLHSGWQPADWVNCGRNCTLIQTVGGTGHNSRRRPVREILCVPLWTTAQCAVYSVQCSVLSVHCAKCTVHSVQCPVYSA